jgi:radical SAM protein with 4Fe4S-binding SPASM domain
MFNVMATTFCNLRCSYCFAGERIQSAARNSVSRGKGRRKEISLENIEILINLFKKWDIPFLNLIGGEPTLHSQLKAILDLAQEHKFSVHLYTNGILEEDLADFLSQREGITYLLNHNPPDFYARLSPDPTPRIDYFLSRCGKRVVLGTNIHRPDFDGGFLVEKIKRFQLPRKARIGFANPICSPGSAVRNDYLRLEDYPQVVPRLVALSKKCDLEGIQLEIDCLAPLCAFTKEEYGELYYNAGVIPRAICSPVVDIGVDLRIWRCFATSGLHNRRKITEFDGPQEIMEYFDKKFLKFQHIGGMERCFRCKFMDRSRCQGGCIGHAINKFHKAAQVR